MSWACLSWEALLVGSLEILCGEISGVCPSFWASDNENKRDFSIGPILNSQGALQSKWEGSCCKKSSQRTSRGSARLQTLEDVSQTLCHFHHHSRGTYYCCTIEFRSLRTWLTLIYASRTHLGIWAWGTTHREAESMSSRYCIFISIDQESKLPSKTLFSVTAYRLPFLLMVICGAADCAPNAVLPRGHSRGPGHRV